MAPKPRLQTLWSSRPASEARHLARALDVPEPELVWTPDRARALQGDVWLEVPVGDWRAASRFVLQEGQLVLAEIRVFPLEPGKGRNFVPGLWSAELLGVRARVPRGGLTARVLRRVRLGEHPRDLRDILAWVAKVYGRAYFDQEAIRRLGLTPPDEARPRPARRAGRPDRVYAVLAAQYVRACEHRGRRPVAAIAARRKVRPETIRDWLHEARVRKLLTPGFPGRSGGQLTPRAAALLGRRRTVLNPPGGRRR